MNLQRKVPSQRQDAYELVTLCRDGKTDKLILYARKENVRQMQIVNLLKAFSDKPHVLVEMLGAYSETLRTTPVHEIFRVADWRVLEEIETKFPAELTLCRELTTLQTVYHVFAQRLRDTCEDPKTYDSYMTLFFVRAGRNRLLVKDRAGCTAVHYLARYRNETACRVLRETFGPDLFHEIDYSGETPTDFHAARLNHDLQRTEDKMKKLATALGIAEDSIAHYQELYGVVAQNTLQKSVHMQVHTHKLAKIEENYDHLRREQEQLVAKQQPLEETIAKLEKERDAAKECAAKAQAERKRVADQLEAQRTEKEKLRSELDRQRSASAENEREIGEMNQEYKKLAERMRKLAEDKVFLEEEAEDGAERAEEFSRQLKQAEDEQAELTARMLEAENARAEFEHTREVAEKKYNDALERTSELESNYAEAEKRCGELRHKLEEMAEEKLRLLEETNQLRANLKRVEADHNAYREQQLVAMAELSRQRDALEAQLNDQRTLLETTREEMDQRTADLQRELDDERALQRSTQETLERQERLEAELAAQKKTAEERLRAMDDQLKQNQLRFQDVRDEAEKQVTEARKWQQLQSEELVRAQDELKKSHSRLEVADSEITTQRTAIETLRKKTAELEIELIRAQQDAVPFEPESSTRGKRPKKSQPDLGKSSTIRRSALASPSDSPLGTPRSDTLTPRTLRKRSTLTRRGIDLPESVTEAQEANALANRFMWNKVAMLVQRGEYEKLHVLLHKDVGLSPNTLDGEKRCLLQISLVAIRDAYKMKSKEEAKKFDKKELKERVRRLGETCKVILDSGGEWPGTDDFVREAGGETAFPAEVWKRIEGRDDYSPFCISLLAVDTLGVSEHIEHVEDLNRIPTAHRSHGYTYLMVAVVLQSASIVQQLVLKGADVMRKDKQGRTALHLAMTKVKDKTTRKLMVEYLLAGGSDPEATCSYKSFLDITRAELRKHGKPNASVPRSPGTKLPPLRLGSKRETVEEKRAKESEEVTSLGSPLKLAMALNDPELLDLMTNYRYRKVTVGKLTEYVAKCVKLNALHERMCRNDELTDDSDSESGSGSKFRHDPLSNLYATYKYTFAAYNPYFERVHLSSPIAYVLQRVAERGGLTKEEEDYPMVREKKIQQCLKSDDLIAITQSIEATGANKITGNANNRVVLANILIECIEALQKKWFEVRDMIDRPAKEIYPEAICAAMHKFVMDDAVDELAFMLRQGSSIFGNVDVNTQIDTETLYTPIEVAAQHGKLRVLEMLLDRQRGRAKQPGADGKSLIGIAMSNHQAASLVAMDHWAFRNNEYREKHENGEMYRLNNPADKQSVLHQLASQRRDDLLRFCLEMPGMGELLLHEDELRRTPVDIASSLTKFQGANDPEAQRAAMECVEILKPTKRSGDGIRYSFQPDDGVEYGGPSELGPPPPLIPPPSLDTPPLTTSGKIEKPPVPPALLRQRASLTWGDTDEETEPPPPPPETAPASPREVSEAPMEEDEVKTPRRRRKKSLIDGKKKKRKSRIEE